MRLYEEPDLLLAVQNAIDDSPLGAWFRSSPGTVRASGHTTISPANLTAEDVFVCLCASVYEYVHVQSISHFFFANFVIMALTGCGIHW